MTVLLENDPWVGLLRRNGDFLSNTTIGACMPGAECLPSSEEEYNTRFLSFLSLPPTAATLWTQLVARQAGKCNS